MCLFSSIPWLISDEAGKMWDKSIESRDKFSDEGSEWIFLSRIHSWRRMCHLILHDISSFLLSLILLCFRVLCILSSRRCLLQNCYSRQEPVEHVTTTIFFIMTREWLSCDNELTTMMFPSKECGLECSSCLSCNSRSRITRHSSFCISRRLPVFPWKSVSHSRSVTLQSVLWLIQVFKWILPWFVTCSQVTLATS